MAAELAITDMPNQYDYHGIHMNAEFSPGEHLDKCREIPLKVGDIVSVSYPRTGTTLVNQIISLILSEDYVFGRAEERKQYIFVDRIDKEGYTGSRKEEDVDPIKAFTEQEYPRFLKTHLTYPMVKNWFDNQDAKLVLILRNPKDALVSLFYFYRGLVDLGCYKGTWDDFFKNYQAGNVCYYGNYLDYSLELWQQRHRDNVHIIFYEDVVKNPVPQIRALAKFLGRDITDEHVEKVAEKSSLKSMKKSIVVTDKRCAESFEFVRKGSIGDWKKHFTVAQNEWMEQLIAKKYAGSGIVFQYE